MSVSSPPLRAISPPTPAPSPQPELQAPLRLASALTQQQGASGGSSRLASASFDANDPAPLLKHLAAVAPKLSRSARYRFLSGLVDLFDLRELAHLSSELGPRLKVDFLSSLPIEVSLHILSFIDDPKTLARASRVSRFWRSLVNDEHTWKAMCLKHKYRRRGSSSAGFGMGLVDERFLRSTYATPRMALPGLGVTAASQSSIDPSASGARGSASLVPLTEVGAADEEDRTPGATSMQGSNEHNLVLASLYQRYRARGLDPSNALHELRTLHDLFLSKQDDGSLADQMTDADRAFYAQLEEIVAEESRERYGDDERMGRRQSGMQEDRGHPTTNLGQVSHVSASPQLPHDSSQDEAGASASNLGWLGAGSSSTSATAARLSAPAHAISAPYRTPTGRLDRLNGWGQRFPTARLSTTDSIREHDTSAAATGLGLSAGTIDMGGIADGGDTEMAPADRAAGDAAPASVNAAALAASNGLPQIPSVDSPTHRFSAPSRSETDSNLAHRRAMLVPGRAAFATPSAPRLDNSWPGITTTPTEQQAGSPLAESSSASALRSANKKARRRSVPAVDADGQPLGLGRPESIGGSGRSVTMGHAKRHHAQDQPFSYRTHFKLAYLTESNWLRGGRFQTKHTSSDAGAVVTSLAIDSEWIVVGMANSKIHVFDAETGLYTQTLLGHESGVWCLTLVSRTGKKRRTRHGVEKAKMVVTDPEDGQGGKPYLAAADGDLRLTHHDPRPDASSALLSDLEYSRYENEKALRRHRHHDKLAEDDNASGKTSQSSSHSFSVDARRPAGAADGDQTLEWFHKARKAMLQRSAGYIGAPNDGSVPSAPEPASPSQGAEAFRNLDSAYNEAAAIAESEAGFVRDAVMSDGTGSVPSHLADEIERNRHDTAMPSTSASELGGNAAGMGNPCGSVLGFGNEDAIVVSGGCDRDVRVWDLRTGECKFVLSGHTSTTRCLKVLDGRPIAVSGSRDSTLRVWDIEKGEARHLLAGHQHSVRCMEVAGNKVASGSYDCTCRVWDVDTGECLRLLRGHIHQIYAVAFDGERIATGSLDSTVRVWSMETGECIALFQGHTSLVGQLQLTDNMLVTGGSDGRVIIFSLETFECIHRLCAHDNSVTCLQFDDRYIVTGGNDGRVKLWDFATGKYIRDVCEPCEQVWKVNYWNDKVVVLCKRGERTCMDVITFRPTADQF